MAYKYLVRPLLEYACMVWNAHTVSDKTSLESVQRRAAHWACGSRWSPVQRQWSKSSDVCLQELHWPTLSSGRNYLSVSMMYDILNGRYDSLKFSDYCNFHTSCTRAHSMTTIHNQFISFFFFCEHSIFMEHCPVCYTISQCTKVSTSAIPSFLSRII